MIRIKILTIDDSAFERKVIEDILRKNGFKEIISAQDGETGIEKYKTEKPDVVLLDVIMPGKSGLQVLKEIKEYDSGAEVILISMSDDREVAEEAERLGARALISKPVTEELVEQLRNIVGLK